MPPPCCGLGSSLPAVLAEARGQLPAWQCVNVERVPAHTAAGVRSNSPKVASGLWELR